MKSITLTLLLLFTSFFLNAQIQSWNSNLRSNDPGVYPYGININATYTGNWSREFSLTHGGKGKLFTFGLLADADNLNYGYIGGNMQNDYVACYQPWMVFKPNGNVGIGTTSPQSNLHIHHGNGKTAYLRLESEFVSQNASVQFCSHGVYRWELGTGISAQSAFELYDRTDGISRIVVLDNGNVGIGTIIPSSKLDVKGTIRATEIKVEAQTADFVFEEDYQLKSLKEVEQFVQENKHLPDIPSAKQMEEDGVGLAEMNKLLLQKVEELTLYSIEQQNNLKKKQAEIFELKNETQNLKCRLEKIERLLNSNVNL
jgi:hypothetical protein